MIYVNCTECGHKLLEGEPGSCVQVKCNKCGSILRVDLTGGGVRITNQRKKAPEAGGKPQEHR